MMRARGHQTEPRPLPGPDCKRFGPLLPLLFLGDDFLGQETPATEAVREHTATCAYCQAMLAIYASEKRALRQGLAARMATDPSYADEIIERVLEEPIMSQLPENSAPYQPPVVVRTEDVAERRREARRRMNRPPRRGKVAAAAWLAPVAAVLLVAVLARLIFTSHPSGAPAHHVPSTPASLSLTIEPYDSQSDGQIVCPRDLAWSPDEQTLAVLGYHYNYVSSFTCSPVYPSGDCIDHGVTGDPMTSDCVLQMSQPGQLNLYDLRTGRLVHQLQLDGLILPHIPLSGEVASYFNSIGFPPNEILGINYTHVLWSPNGRTLAVTFTVDDVTDIHSGVWSASNPHVGDPIATTLIDGVLLLDASLKHPRVLTTTLDSRAPLTTVWNLNTGQALSGSSAVSGGTGTITPVFTAQPLAESYTWTADGSLLPQTALPSSPGAPLPGPVGIPDGGSSFGIWQSGVVDSGFTQAGGQSGVDNFSVYTFSMDTAAWSPDGTYLAERVSVTGMLSSQYIPLPEASELAPYGWAQAPVLPVRDPGLQQAITLATNNGFNGLTPLDNLGYQSVDANAALVSWRPDGKVIAVAGNTPNHAVYLYSCATGKLLATLRPGQSQGIQEQNDLNVLRWSPNGSQVALYDTQLGIISIWG